MPHIDRAKDLAARESGLAVAITSRTDGSPRASVVNAGVVAHPISGEHVVAFVSRGAVKKLEDLRRVPHATVVFRSGWEWVAVEGAAVLVGPDDHLEGLAESQVTDLIHTIYASAVGGMPEQWSALNTTIRAERHTAVLIQPNHIYPAS